MSEIVVESQSQSQTVVDLGPDFDMTKYCIKDLNSLISTYPNVDPKLIAKFLIQAIGDIEKCIIDINTHITWKDTNWPILKSSCIKELETGKLYTHGYDKEGHPLIIFNAGMHDINIRDLDEFQRLHMFMLEIPKDSDKGKVQLCIVCII